MMIRSTLPMDSTSIGAVTQAAKTAAGFRVFSTRLQCVTTRPFEVIDLTARVAELIGQSGIDSGMAHVQSLHTTTALFLNENQAALLDDVESLVRLLVEERRGWRHNDRRYSDCDRRNAAAHLRSLIVGHAISMQVENGRPLLGKWQAALFMEMDGPQTRNLSVRIMGV